MFNLLLLSIPLGALVGLWPSLKRMDLEGKHYDNMLGRASLQASKDSMPEEEFARAMRCQNAGLNHVEHFPLFAAAVLIANNSTMDKTLATVLAYGWDATRIVYNFSFINGTKRWMAKLRTITFLTAQALSLTLIFCGAKDCGAKKDIEA